jgi:hypothetical protein
LTLLDSESVSHSFSYEAYAPVLISDS